MDLVMRLLGNLSDMEIVHEGKLHRSGRHPWGSGENPYQHPYKFKDARAFYDYYRTLRKTGLSDSDIAKALSDDGEPMTTPQLKIYRSIAKDYVRIENRAEALGMLDSGMNVSEIGRVMGVNESTVRGWLKETTQIRANKTTSVANVLRKAVDERGIIDVSEGTENLMSRTIPGITQSRLDKAIVMLQGEGYEYFNNIKVPQMTTGHDTTFRVLAPPGTTMKDVYEHRGDIQLIEAYYDRGTESLHTFKPPRSVDSKRLQVLYAENGGSDKDGMIELRRGVPELDLGANHAAQVRIAVDGSHYLKGMALYADDLPPGIDIRFNTSKHDTGNKLDALKPLKVDESGDVDKDLPFGSVIKYQPMFINAKGERELSALNVVNEEGSWNNWSQSLSSQFLSKQSVALARQQLSITLDAQKEELRTIMGLENPVIKQELLNSFADDCESKAVHMKAAGLPRQTTKALLSFPSLKENEVYTTEYEPGTNLALVRFPHQSTAEIPRVVVNNSNKEAAKAIGNSIDFIGINPAVARQLSGADMDGDSVICLVNNDGRIKADKAVKALVEFEPKEYFKKTPDMVPTGVGKYTDENGVTRKKDGFKKGYEMGMASNLITDMTLQGVSAFDEEMIRAIKYAQVVIDAEKHNLDWKAARNLYGIDNLERKYTAHFNKQGEVIYGGGSTLISMRKKTIDVPEQKMYGRIDKETGKVNKLPTNRKYDAYKKLGLISDVELSPSELQETVIGSNGVEHPKYRINKRGVVSKYVGTKEAKTKIPLVLAVDAHTIGQGTRMENVYADYIEDMKSLATEARRISANLPTKRLSNEEARVKYADERASLLAKWDAAKRRKPYQRQALRLARAQLDEKLRANPSIEFDKDALKKLTTLCYNEGRARVGLVDNDKKIPITEREWEAIQNGAISADKLRDLFKMGDPDDFKRLAMPKTGKPITPAIISKIRARVNMGYGINDVAKQLGISEASVKKYALGGE